MADIVGQPGLLGLRRHSPAADPGAIRYPACLSDRFRALRTPRF
jgi:hypothetical protein